MRRELEVAVVTAETAGEVLRSGFGQQQDVRYRVETDSAPKWTSGPSDCGGS